MKSTEKAVGLGKKGEKKGTGEKSQRGGWFEPPKQEKILGGKTEKWRILRYFSQKHHKKGLHFMSTAYILDGKVNAVPCGAWGIRCLLSLHEVALQTEIRKLGFRNDE